MNALRYKLTATLKQTGPLFTRRAGRWAKFNRTNPALKTYWLGASCVNGTGEKVVTPKS